MTTPERTRQAAIDRMLDDAARQDLLWWVFKLPLTNKQIVKVITIYCEQQGIKIEPPE